MTRHFMRLTHRTGLFATLLALGLTACSILPRAHHQGPTTPTTPLTAPYKGVFISNCSELGKGLYYADAMTLAPRDDTFVDAQYVKVFFTSPQCEGRSKLVQLRLPPTIWKIVGQTLVGDKQAEQVEVTLTAGTLGATIANPERVKETETTIIISYGEKKESLPFLKKTEASVSKELRLLDGGRLYQSDPGSPVSPDGYPSQLTLDDYFNKQ